MIERLFFYHMRRAGGTSLRRYCERVSREKDLQYKAVEGHSLDYERYFGQSHSTVHIVCLRHPIERIKSAYRFEGRWPQHEVVRTVQNEKPFSTWIDETRCDSGTSSFLWSCTENYYVKALIGYPRVGATSLGQPELRFAKRRLEAFEIVLLTDHLSDRGVGSYLRQMLDVDVPITHQRYPELESPQATDKQLFDANTLARVRDSNTLDMQLFAHAKTLFQRRLEQPRRG